MLRYTPTLDEDGDLFRLRVRLGKQSSSDTPIALTVLVRSSSGIALQARAWLAVPSMLAMNSSQREIRTAVRDVCGAVFGGDEDAVAVSEAFSQFLTELGELSHHRLPGTHTNESKQSPHEETDKTISADDFIVSDNALGSLRASHYRIVQAFNGIALLLHKLLLDAADTEDEEAPLDPTSDDDDSSDIEQKKRAAAEHKSSSKKAAVLLAQISQDVSNAIDECLRQPVTERYLPFILNVPQALIAYIQFHVKFSKRLKLDPGHGLAFTIRDALQRIFSTDGILSGGSFGWLVLAWSSDEVSAAMREHLTDAKRVDELRLFVAAGLAVDGPVSATDTVAWSILAGLHLVSGKDPSATTQEELSQQLKGTGRHSIGTITVTQMVGALHSYGRLTSKILPLVRFWSNLLEGKDSMDIGMSRVQRKSITHVDVTESGVSCCGCHRVLPTNISMRFPPHEIERVQCCYCHRLIVPLAFEDNTVERVLTWLNSLQGETIK
jgi:hypothetical protein